MLDVRRLRLLRELALRGTIAAVAEALSFTPSAVSQQLSALEREAGVPLLERTGRRVRLTPAAERLVVHAEALLARLETAAAELAATGGGPEGPGGPVRIGAFPSATRSLVPAALNALTLAHPALEPQVTEVDPAAVAHALRAGELDVALVHTYDRVPPPEAGLEAVPLCAERMYLAVPAARAPRTLAECGDQPWITATEGTLCRTMTVRACRSAGFLPRTRHRIDDFGTVLALVAAGQGVALVPESAVEQPPGGVALTALDTVRRTAVAHRAGAGGRPAVAVVVEALRAAVPDALREPAARR